MSSGVQSLKRRSVVVFSTGMFSWRFPSLSLATSTVSKSSVRSFCACFRFVASWFRLGGAGGAVSVSPVFQTLLWRVWSFSMVRIVWVSVSAGSGVVFGPGAVRQGTGGLVQFSPAGATVVPHLPAFSAICPVSHVFWPFRFAFDADTLCR